MDDLMHQAALSFAEEQRHYVAGAAEQLRSRPIGVFYYDFDTVSLSGRNGTEAFQGSFPKQSA